MQTELNIPTNPVLPDSTINQAKKTGHWLGHLWSFIFKQFTQLIVRIKNVASLALSNTKIISPQQQSSTKQFKKENKLEENEIVEELCLDDLFLQETEDETNDKAGNAPIASSPSHKQNETDELLSEDQKVIIKVNNAETTPPVQANSVTAVKIETQDEPNPKQEPSNDETSPLSEDLNPKKGDANQKGRQRRIRRKKKNASSISSPKPSEPVSVKAPSQPTKKKATIIDAGGEGNCQLLSFLKGLEMQYPDLTKYQENGVSVEFTAQKLRTVGVDFAREQIDKCGTYAEEVMGYADADRAEHNKVIGLQADSYQASFIKEKGDLDKLLKTKKIKQEQYQKQIQALRGKHLKLVEYLEASKISTDEEFFNRLQQNGFFCSSLHLFVLSVKFELPIYVHEKNGIPGHDIQMFNPTGSEKSPIHLYRVGNMHYQLMLIPT
jgi:hypothetical protein